MTWQVVTIGGITIPVRSIHGLDITERPVTDFLQRTDPTGSTVQRAQWQKSVIEISAEGADPPLLQSLDYSAPMVLEIDRYTAEDTYTRTSYTVLTRPPELLSNAIRSIHRWRMVFTVVDAEVIHALPFTFTLDGVSPHKLSQLDFTQQLTPRVGGGIIQLGSGAAVRREHWRKQTIRLAGGGWVPLNGLDDLDYANSMQLTISRLASIDTNGNPVYTDTSYTVLSEGPRHDWDMVARLYRWSLDCEEA